MVSCRVVYSLRWEAVYSLIPVFHADWTAAAGSGSSLLVIVLGVIFVVVVVFPIAWNTTNTLYEFFVVFLSLVVLDLYLILGPTGRRFCSVGVIVVLFVSVVLDGAVGAVGCIKVDFRAAAAAGTTTSSSVVFVFGLFLLGSSSVDCKCGAVCAVSVIFVVVFIGVVFSAVVFGVCVVSVGDLYFLALSSASAYFLVLVSVITGDVDCAVRINVVFSVVVFGVGVAGVVSVVGVVCIGVCYLCLILVLVFLLLLLVCIFLLCWYRGVIFLLLLLL